MDYLKLSFFYNYEQINFIYFRTKQIKITIKPYFILLQGSKRSEHNTGTSITASVL